MDTAIVVAETGEIKTLDFSDGEIQLIKDTIAKGCDDDELKLFLYQCKRTGLDPFSRQIYVVKRWDNNLKKKVATIQTGIDGYRVIAERSKTYAGCDAPEFTLKFDGNLESATVTVYRLIGSQRVGFSHTAYWDEYVQTTKEGDPTRFWAKMPRNQLVKCAEAGALRKAFPQDLSGIYTADEMAQAENTPPAGNGDGTTPHPAKEKPATASAARPGGNSAPNPSTKGDWDGQETIHFGKHNGKPWADLPEDYVDWVVKNTKDDSTRDMAQAELNRRSGTGAEEINDDVSELEDMSEDRLVFLDDIMGKRNYTDVWDKIKEKHPDKLSNQLFGAICKAHNDSQTDHIWDSNFGDLMNEWGLGLQ